MNKEKIYSQLIHAFIDKKYDYYFDKINNRIVFLAKLAKDYEFGDFEACEALNIERNTENFVKIQKLETEEEFEWMDDFCFEHANFAKLAQSLKSDNPFEKFYSYLKQHKELETEWNEFLESKLYKEAKKFICRI